MPDDWQVLLITGPAGAGKTALADAFARALPPPAVHISIDDVRGLVKSGFANPQLGWTRETGRQLALAQSAAASTARLYIAAGFRCVVDDAIFPDWTEAYLPAWEEKLLGLRWRLVVLMPHLEVCLARNRIRLSHVLSDELVATIHEMMQPWRNRGYEIIDNSGLSIEEAVERLRTCLLSD